MKGMKAVVLLGFGYLMVFCPIVIADENAEGLAVRAAMEWLALVDNGKYMKSWLTAAEYFQNAVAKEQWQRSLTAVRKPLGKVISRKLRSKLYTTSLPGAPDGAYVVIQFDTSFEKKRSAIETVTPMLDRADEWKVSGYFIK